eukprot:966798-Lingulodinium_polyedra.AAC.1
MASQAALTVTASPMTPDAATAADPPTVAGGQVMSQSSSQTSPAVRIVVEPGQRRISDFMAPRITPVRPEPYPASPVG